MEHEEFARRAARRLEAVADRTEEEARSLEGACPGDEGCSVAGAPGGSCSERGRGTSRWFA